MLKTKVHHLCWQFSLKNGWMCWSVHTIQWISVKLSFIRFIISIRNIYFQSSIVLYCTLYTIHFVHVHSPFPNLKMCAWPSVYPLECDEGEWATNNKNKNKDENVTKCCNMKYIKGDEQRLILSLESDNQMVFYLHSFYFVRFYLFILSSIHFSIFSTISFSRKRKFSAEFSVQLL